MAPFEFNLIRSDVAPLKQRRLQLRALIAYLLICAVALVWVFGKSTRAFLDASLQAKDIKRLEADFQLVHPEQDDIIDYASLLKYNMKVMSDTVGLLESTIGNRSDVSRILLGLSAPLPARSFITDFRITTLDSTCSFDVSIPISGTTVDIPNASALVTLWSADTALMDEINNLSATASRRNLISGVPHFVLKFKGEIKKKATS